jgi:alkanesulfonate monooxygenase SsuD/methylene tetrahydromethanopterin reductase-like flavin-dependent oxidoreductase (luciferase family)
VTGHIEVALPFWLDRPDEEALDIALASRAAGFDTLWVGEMATYDAFALATAVGHRAPGVRLKIGPLALGVRSPVALALGASSVASLTGCELDIALGASSGNRGRLARPPVGAPRRTHARDHRVSEADPGRRAGRLRRTARAQPWLSATKSTA